MAASWLCSLRESLYLRLHCPLVWFFNLWSQDLMFYSRWAKGQCLRLNIVKELQYNLPQRRQPLTTFVVAIKYLQIGNPDLKNKIQPSETINCGNSHEKRAAPGSRWPQHVRRGSPEPLQQLLYINSGK